MVVARGEGGGREDTGRVWGKVGERSGEFEGQRQLQIQKICKWWAVFELIRASNNFLSRGRRVQTKSQWLVFAHGNKVCQERREKHGNDEGSTKK